MKNVIQITDKILGVIVDESSFDFMFSSAQDDADLICKNGKSIAYIGTFKKCEYKIHGTCTLPLFDFDFEVDESWVEKKKFNKGVFIEDTYLYRDYLSSNENMCFVGLPEYECRVKSFKSKIQKAIQDEGMFVVNPYGENKPQELVDYTGRKDGIIANSLELEQWQSAETKTVKKLLLIEKI